METWAAEQIKQYRKQKFSELANFNVIQDVIRFLKEFKNEAESEKSIINIKESEKERL